MTLLSPREADVSLQQLARAALHIAGPAGAAVRLHDNTTVLDVPDHLADAVLAKAAEQPLPAPQATALLGSAAPEPAAFADTATPGRPAGKPPGRAAGPAGAPTKTTATRRTPRRKEE